MEISENSATLEILNSSGSVIITPVHIMHRSALYTLSTEWMHKRACARVGIFSECVCVLSQCHAGHDRPSTRY